MLLIVDSQRAEGQSGVHAPLRPLDKNQRHRDTEADPDNTLIEDPWSENKHTRADRVDASRDWEKTLSRQALDLSKKHRPDL